MRILRRPDKWSKGMKLGNQINQGTSCRRGKEVFQGDGVLQGDSGRLTDGLTYGVFE